MNSELVAKASSLLGEDEIDTEVLRCLLSRSAILRDALETDSSEFLRRMKEETIILQGEPLMWLLEHSDFIKDSMEVQASQGCPDVFLQTPEEVELLLTAEPNVFPFLRLCAQGKPIGEYTGKDGDYTIRWSLSFYDQERIANLFDFLLWNSMDPNRQLKDLIDHGSLTQAPVIGHVRTYKEPLRTSAAYATPNEPNWNEQGNEYESVYNSGNINNINNINNRNDQYIVRGKPKAPRLADNVNEPGKPSHKRSSNYSKKRGSKKYRSTRRSSRSRSRRGSRRRV